MKLAQGDVVVILLPSPVNGSETAPAIINRVWDDRDTRDGPRMVNCTAFPDCGVPTTFTSVKVFQERPEGEAFTHAWLRERDRLADVHPALAAAHG